MLSIEPFLSAYDPSDLPGASVDPLGFERGYLFLADHILPGLTNAAAHPRYLSMLCAAIAISDEQHRDSGGETPRVQRQRRQDAVLRMERLWALSVVLASDVEPLGLRGLRDAQREARRLEERGRDTTRGDYRLLARQSQYGVLGIYGNVGERLGLVTRDPLVLGTRLGESLAGAFRRETKIRKEIVGAVGWGGEVAVSALKSWGKWAHIQGRLGAEEGARLKEALDDDPVRCRMIELLKDAPRLGEDDSELARFERIEAKIAADEEQRDIAEALRLIREYEACYRHCALVFLRFLARAPFDIATLDRDEVLRDSHAAVRKHTGRLQAAYTHSSLASDANRDRFEPVLQVLDGLSGTSNATDFGLAVLERHRLVQHAKRGGGRPKMPWLELDRKCVRLTLTAMQAIDRELTSSEEVAPHSYRTAMIDNLHAGLQAT